MFRIVLRPARPAARTASAQLEDVFEGSEVRISVMPLAAKRSSQSSVTGGGEI